VTDFLKDRKKHILCIAGSEPKEASGYTYDHGPDRNLVYTCDGVDVIMIPADRFEANRFGMVVVPSYSWDMSMTVRRSQIEGSKPLFGKASSNQTNEMVSDLLVHSYNTQKQRGMLFPELQPGEIPDKGIGSK